MAMRIIAVGDGNDAPEPERVCAPWFEPDRAETDAASQPQEPATAAQLPAAPAVSADRDEAEPAGGQAAATPPPEADAAIPLQASAPPPKGVIVAKAPAKPPSEAPPASESGAPPGSVLRSAPPKPRFSSSPPKAAPSTPPAGPTEPWATGAAEVAKTGPEEDLTEAAEALPPSVAPPAPPRTGVPNGSSGPIPAGSFPPPGSFPAPGPVPRPDQPEAAPPANASPTPATAPSLSIEADPSPPGPSPDPTPDADQLGDSSPQEVTEVGTAVSEEATSSGDVEPGATTTSFRPKPSPPKRPRRSAAMLDDSEPEESRSKRKSKRARRPWWEEMFSEDFVRAERIPSEGDVKREVDFIVHSLGVQPGGVVLDLGCGGGRHTVELASRGFGVVGYDLSLFQLAIAGEHAQERNQKINFLQGDMREMAFEETFDAICAWNTTFGYFEEDKNLEVAERIFKALRPGGTFLLDVINRDFVAANEPPQMWFDGDSCVCMDDPAMDYITSRLRIKRSIILDDGRTRECTYSVRLYALHELGKLLHEVGFKVRQASGHPTTPGAFFGPNSPRIIMLAQRP